MFPHRDSRAVLVERRFEDGHRVKRLALGALAEPTRSQVRRILALFLTSKVKYIFLLISMLLKPQLH